MERITKKDLAAGMYERGMTVNDIAELLHCAPSYVANSLIERGIIPNYSDLYTATGPQNRYAATLSGVLRFKDVEAARESIRRIHELYEAYAALRDRVGMHQCQVVALTGKNRAEGIGKLAEAQVFADWLKRTLHIHYPDPVLQVVGPEREEEPEPVQQLLPMAA